MTFISSCSLYAHVNLVDNLNFYTRTLFPLELSLHAKVTYVILLKLVLLH